MESQFQKNKRLKTRKQVYTETFRNGLFMTNKGDILKWLRQDDVVIRIHKAGLLDDDTEFFNITIEGYKSENNGL